MEGENLLPLWCDLGGDDQGGGGDATQLGVGRVHHLHHQEELLLPELHCGTMGEADPVPAAPHRQHELRHDEAGEDAWQGGGKGSPDISTPHMLWR